MGRLHAKDSTANKRRAAPMYEGIGSCVCTQCKSRVVYAIVDRPEKCAMCGSELPKAEVANFDRPSKKVIAKAESHYLAGAAKRIGEIAKNPEAGSLSSHGSGGKRVSPLTGTRNRDSYGKRFR